MMRIRWGVAAFVMLAATWCAGSPTGPDAEIVVRDVHFAPVDVTVPVGGTVRWTFDDGGVLHHVGSEGEFDSGIIPEGSFEHTFTTPGVYEYHCSVHRYMTGTVTVTG
ncbi:MULTISPECIES: cupredoxin domain-containing protein [Rhodococcus]|uniref:cupredoxin domain-containing protein n=1 Tax=Rhodococcus TaxID=1827 RepID=UPI000A018C81|nr:MULTISPECIES: cupredoxin domain-containing protein [Rhodococcus]MCD2117130.1 cupredoxin domain-containing protein [Rhodococcus pyridinivorans]MCZ4626252.1 cupredoxin domain-containing protein [Rhodococcus pyridinivorans]MCZ4647207.1 cupredoxin domain-containing protein [Rhodococcus pyridinivorans]MDJ0481952.1 cupredoxin domain-containing protein [Rhodococcus pyridinivorans]MDV7253310.1 cupredoxin domain-containing protein [Rhodococcus pyridinivorans]